MTVAAAVPRQYTRRQLLALERADTKDRQEMHSGDVFKRDVEMIDIGKGKLIQMVSALHVNLDDWPEWDASVGFMEGGNSGLMVHQRAWTEQMWESANRMMRDLITMPYEVAGVRSAWKTKARPSEWHVLFRVTAIERDWITAIQCGGMKPSVYVQTNPKDRTRH